LFLIVVRRREVVLGEIYRVLDAGGKCFIAEPTSGFRTRIPLAVMWLLSKVSSTPAGDYREPRQTEVMAHGEFRRLIESQPWSSVQYHNDGWYQYAVCEKGRA
jgi:ubiquinone/menaquinone biosynthesis C-methylase UbiE